MTTVAGYDPSLTAAGIVVLSDDRKRIPYNVDPATNAAAAALRPNCVWPILARNVGIPGRETDGWLERSRRIRAVSLHLQQLTKMVGQIDLAVIEAPLEAGQIQYSYGDRFALFHAVYGFLDAAGVPVCVVVNQHGHQFVTGLGRVSEDKHEVVDAVNGWWPGAVKCPDHNIGDAYGFGMMGAMHLGANTPFRPAARHYNVLASVTWPGQPRKPKPAKKPRTPRPKKAAPKPAQNVIPFDRVTAARRSPRG